MQLFFLVAQFAEEAPTSRACLVPQQRCTPGQQTCSPAWRSADNRVTGEGASWAGLSQRQHAMQPRLLAPHFSNTLNEDLETLL